MVNRNDAHEDALLQQAIDHLRKQEIPEFPDPEILAIRSTVRGSSSNRATFIFWRVIMNRRFQLSAGGILSAAVLMGFLMFWEGITVKSLSAMEKMTENIRMAQTFQATIHFTSETLLGPNKKKFTAEITGSVYWKAPNLYRVEEKGGQNASGIDRVTIFSRSKPGIEIDQAKKEFRQQPPRQGACLRLMMIDKLGDYRGQAEQDLGAKEIHGIKARGFLIDGKHIDPDSSADTKAEIWTDTQSNLPILVIYRMKMADSSEGTMRMENIQWNVEFDSQLFATTPPENYKESQLPSTLSTEQQRQQIIDALRIYAELNDNHYPPVKRIYGDQIMAEVRKKLDVGLDSYPSQEQMRDEKVRKAFMERYMKARNVSFGMGMMTLIQRDNPDSAYYGKTVGPKDKDKVLFRWKLDNGQYEAIFGDLHAESVTAERLHSLEGKTK